MSNGAACCAAAAETANASNAAVNAASCTAFSITALNSNIKSRPSRPRSLSYTKEPCKPSYPAPPSESHPDPFQLRLGITRACRHAAREGFSQRRYRLRRQGQIHRLDVLLEIFAMAGAGQCDDEGLAAQHPGQGQLRRGTALLGRQSGEGFKQHQVAAEVLRLEARMLAPPVV